MLSEWSGEDAAAGVRRAAASRRPTPTPRSPTASPTTSPAPVEGLPPFAGGAVGFFGYDLVRTVEPLGEPNPDPLGLPDMALMVTDAMLVFDHLRHELTILACAFADDEGGIDAAYERAAATIAEMRERLRGAVPAPSQPVGRRAARVRLQHGARGVRSRGRADRRVRPRRRRLPGRPLAALLRTRPGRGLLGLPRPARGQPLALHVLPRVRRLPDRRRLAGAAGQGQRRPGRDAADRRHLPARAQRGRGPPPRRAADQRPEGAGRARDAGRPRPQRPRPGLRVRHGQGRRADGGRDLLARPPHRQPGLRHAARGRQRDGRAALGAARRHPLRRARRCGRCRSSTSSSRSSAAPTAARSATSPGTATSTPRSTSAPSSSRTASSTSRPAAAPSPTPSPPTSTSSRVNKANAVFRAVEVACEQPDWA